MALQYVLAGGQLKIDKKVLTRELLLPVSSLKQIVNSEDCNVKPKITKSGELVIIDYNDSSDILLDESFYDLFKKLKMKYREKIKGKVVIRITALTSYYVVLNLDSDDEKVIHE